MTFRPTACRVAVRLDPRRATFALGALHPASLVGDASATMIVAPDEYQEQPCSGVVVAVGPGTPESPMQIEVGQRVLLGKYNGIALSSDYFDRPGEYVVLDARHDKPKPHVPDVYGVIEEEAT
jgi:co-chaperonin GroES (HSP10)